MGVKCFMVHATERFRLTLRRYVHSDRGTCPGEMTYHNAHGPEIGIIDGVKSEDGCWSLTAMEKQHAPPHEDSRWPTKCDGCDYQFTAEDEFQLFSEHIYLDDAGKEHRLRDSTPGMMWDAEWMNRKGPDGKCLVVICPNGHQWMIDGRASNCTMPTDTTHRCWTRVGTPPLIQVGKQWGMTCAAGAGSIQAGNYHGFLGIQGAAPGYFT